MGMFDLPTMDSLRERVGPYSFAHQIFGGGSKGPGMPPEREYSPGERADINAGGYSQDNDQLRRQSNYNYGRSLGQREFYDDPDMQAALERRKDLAKGYEGKELGAIRQEAKQNNAGQRSNYLNALRSNMARGGVGGARGAAMQNQASQKYALQGADSERKLALDSANMKRQGTNDLQDFIFRQKLGATGMGYGQQALGASDYAAQRGVAANAAGGGKK